MNHEWKKLNETIYSEMEKSLESNLQDILAEDYFEKKRAEFMNTIDINAIIQEDIREQLDDSRENNQISSTINTINAFQEAISKVPNGTVLRVDKKVLIDSIKRDTIHSMQYSSYKSKEEKVSNEWRQIINEVCLKQDDFLIAFYIIYVYLDKNCKLDSILPIFNQFYQTDYKSFEDILEKNHLKSIFELRKYVDTHLGDSNKNRKIY